MNNERQFYTSQLSDTQYLQLVKAFELIYDSEVVLRGAQYLMGQTYPPAYIVTGKQIGRAHV